MQRYSVLFLFVLFIFAACTNSNPEEDEHLEPIDASTPTAEPKVEFLVTFEGNGCTVEGPSEVLPGDYGFKFVDKSDVKGELWLIYLDEDKTIQDLNDLQSVPGEYNPKPSWASYSSKISSEFEENEEGKVERSFWRLDKIGEYTILCYVDSLPKIWHVAPIYVVEKLSD